MIRSFKGFAPVIAPSAYISEVAYVVGDVDIGEGSSVWPGAVVRGDTGPIRIGKNTNIQDNSAVHTDNGLDIGEGVTIGHCCVVHCRKIGNYVLIGNNATVLEDVEIGDYSVIGANAMVRAGMKIPPHSVVIGIPGQIKGAITDAQRQMIERFCRNYVARAQAYKAEGL